MLKPADLSAFGRFGKISSAFPMRIKSNFIRGMYLIDQE
jgi:hypothetical protein